MFILLHWFPNHTGGMILLAGFWEINKTIVTTDSTKDLGITITRSLTWDSHYKVISSKAYKILGLICCSFSSSGPVLSRRKLYISLVRSQVSPIWRPCLIKHIKMLERIQREATKWILNDYLLSHRYRLMSLHLLPLMYIYELNDVIFFIKSHKQPSSHFNINDYINFSTSLSLTSTRSGSSDKMVHYRCSSNFLQNFYFHRLPTLWNSLPRIDLSLSTSAIKDKLLCKFILLNSLMTPMLTPFIISVLVVTV